MECPHGLPVLSSCGLCSRFVGAPALRTPAIAPATSVFIVVWSDGYSMSIDGVHSTRPLAEAELSRRFGCTVETDRDGHSKWGEYSVEEWPVDRTKESKQ